MSCESMRADGRAPHLLHRLICRECRRSAAADRAIALGLACLRAAPARADGLARSLTALGLDAASRRIARRDAWRAARRKLRIALYGPAALAVLGMGWLWWCERDPGIVVPARSLPAVNGYDYLLEAGSALVDSDAIAAALKPPAAERTAPVPAQAVAPVPASVAAQPSAPVPAGSPSPVAPPAAMASQPPPPAGTAAPASGVAPTPAPTLGQLQGILDRNADALAMARKALAMRYMEPRFGTFQPVPHLAHIRQLGRLLALEARVRARRGDAAGAMDSALDAVALGVHTQPGGGFMTRYVGHACGAAGRAEAWNLVDRLDAAGAARAARRLDHIRAQRLPLADAVANEEASVLVGLRSMFSTSRPQMLLDLFAQPDSSSVQIGFYSLLLPSKARIAANFREAMATERMLADQPYQTLRAFPETPRGDKVTEMLMPSARHAAFAHASDAVQTDLLAVAVALRRYRLAHGGYPLTLSALADGWLSGLPVDAFGNGMERLRYVRRGTTYLLYSVGPDGVDGGGAAPWLPAAYGVQPRATLGPDSAGDVPAGWDPD